MGDVSIEINGREFLGWKTVNISRSLDSLCGTFSLTYTDAWDFEQPENLVSSILSIFAKPKEKSNTKKWYIEPGDGCVVRIDGTPVLTGYVDEIGSSISSDSRQFSVSGRDVTCDLVDCAATAESFETWTNLKLSQIASIICEKFELSVQVESQDGAKFPRVTSEGQTAHEILDRLARQRGILLTTSKEGLLVLTKPGASKAKVALNQGENVLSASLKVDHKNRYSKYFVYGQAVGDAFFLKGETIRKAKKTAKDESILRYRPKVIQNDDSTSDTEAEKRVQWEAIHNASRGTRVNVTVNGWRQGEKETDPLWSINSLVQCNIKSIGIDEELLIESVNYRLTDQGEITELGLTRSDAWIPNPTVKKDKEPGFKLRTGAIGGKSEAQQTFEKYGVKF